MLAVAEAVKVTFIVSLTIDVTRFGRLVLADGLSYAVKNLKPWFDYIKLITILPAF